MNRITRLANGEWKWRFDLCYPEFKILVEYDGEQHLEGNQRKLDDARRKAIQALGWIVIVITKDDLYKDPAGVLVRVRDALLGGAAPAFGGTSPPSGIGTSRSGRLAA